MRRGAPRRGARESGRWSPRRRRRAASRRSPGTSSANEPLSTSLGERQQQLGVVDRAGALGRDGSDRRHDVVDPDARAAEVVDRRAIGSGDARGDERAGDVARVLELGAAAVGDRVGDAGGRGEHRLGRSRGDALVAADAVDGVRPQADARDTVLGPVDPGGRLVGALVDAVDRPGMAGHRRRRVLLGRVERGDRRGVDDRGHPVGASLDRLEDVDRAEHVDARPERRVGAAERHLERGEVDHVRDLALVERRARARRGPRCRPRRVGRRRPRRRRAAAVAGAGRSRGRTWSPPCRRRRARRTAQAPMQP